MRVVVENPTASYRNGKGSFELHGSMPEIHWLDFGKRRAAGELAESGVSDVLQIRDADLTGVEAVTSELP